MTDFHDGIHLDAIMLDPIRISTIVIIIVDKP